MHARKFLAVAALRAVVVLIMLALPQAEAAEIWDGPAFVADAKEIAEAASRLVDAREPDIVVFLDETRIAIDTAHRVTETRRLVYRIGAKPDESWSVAEVIWQPWRQQRPSVRARVISPEGRAIELDQSTLTETPMRSLADNIFGDDRLLRAPLPAISSAAVVEIEYVLKDTAPAFSGGIVGKRNFGREVSVLRTVLSIESPDSLTA